MKKYILLLVLMIQGAQAFADMTFFSQNGQDAFIFKTFFPDKRNGVFMEIGAHDGIDKSNTYFFEKYLNWTGFCVEPLPNIFTQLTKNRNCICINGCISEAQGTKQFLQITGYSEMLSGLIAKYDPRHIHRIDREIAEYGGKKEVIEVQCYRFMDVAQAHNITHIDYLSIDTEGSELEILKSIDFSTVDIDVITVENNYFDPAFKGFLEKKNYRFIGKLGGDEIYKKIK